jgi:N-acetylmuramic acid 6-phosphate etherase
MKEELKPTERPNPGSTDLDLLTPLEVVELINREDRKVAEAVGKCSQEIAVAVRGIMDSFAAGGRLIYIGAGTSGRLGVLDASECPPTFSTPPEQVVGIIAGGETALRHPIEGAEDDADAGRMAMEAIGLSRADTLCGIAASGRTPYVGGALALAAARGSFTILVTCDPRPELSATCVIAPEVGPEVVAGSTRLKAGTATKLVLNALTTASLALSGKVYSNLMVDVRPSNAKLVKRAHWLLKRLLSVDESTAAALLRSSGNNVKVAVVMHACQLDKVGAEARLAACGGFLRKALGEGRDHPGPP